MTEMRKYRYMIEAERTSCISLEIEAADKGEAKRLAWRDLESRRDVGNADWEITLLEKMED